MIGLLPEWGHDMFTRITTALAAIGLACLVMAPAALAAKAPSDPPEPGAELVSRQTVNGADAVKAALTSIDGVEVGPEAAIITVDDDKGPHEIRLDYGDFAKDKKTVGAGYLAGGFVGLGLVRRILKVVREVRPLLH